MLFINATQRACVRAFEHVLGGTELLKWRALSPSGRGELFHDAQYTTHTHFASTSCEQPPHCFISTKVVLWVRSCAIYYIVLCSVYVCVCAPCVNGYANWRADKTRLRLLLSLRYYSSCWMRTKTVTANQQNICLQSLGWNKKCGCRFRFHGSSVTFLPEAVQLPKKNGRRCANKKCFSLELRRASLEVGKLHWAEKTIIYFYPPNWVRYENFK